MENADLSFIITHQKMEEFNDNGKVLLFTTLRGKWAIEIKIFDAMFPDEVLILEFVIEDFNTNGVLWDMEPKFPYQTTLKAEQKFKSMISSLEVEILKIYNTH